MIHAETLQALPMPKSSTSTGMQLPRYCILYCGDPYYTLVHLYTVHCRENTSSHASSSDLGSNSQKPVPRGHVFPTRVVSSL